MGLLITRFQAKRSHGKALEELEKRINALEVQRKHIFNRHKTILEQFLTSSVATYIVCILLFYNFFYPDNLKYKIISYIPIILSPALIATTKRIITWFYRLKLSRTEDHIDILENEKIKILDGIIKTESYMEAKKYFDKYAPRHRKKLGFPIKLESSEKIVPRRGLVLESARDLNYKETTENESSRDESENTENSSPSNSQRGNSRNTSTSDAQRGAISENTTTSSDAQRAFYSRQSGKASTLSNMQNRNPNNPEDLNNTERDIIETNEFNFRNLNSVERELNSINLAQSDADSTPSSFKQEFLRNLNNLTTAENSVIEKEIRAKLSKMPQRYVFDQLIDYLSGDGPSSRYALICRNCARHNGMALKEDFQFISFRCCYCYSLNPAKKNRLPVVNLEFKVVEEQEGEKEQETVKDTEVLYSKTEGYEDVTESESKIVQNIKV